MRFRHAGSSVPPAPPIRSPHRIQRMDVPEIPPRDVVIDRTADTAARREAGYTADLSPTVRFALRELAAATPPPQDSPPAPGTLHEPPPAAAPCPLPPPPAPVHRHVVPPAASNHPQGAAARARRKAAVRTRLAVAQGVFFLLTLLFGGLFARDFLSYRQTDLLYTTLAAQVGPAEAAAPAAPEVDFAALAAVNPDIAAWVSLPGLACSLPVVQGADNQTYLRTRFDGTQGNGGCLFLDAQIEGGSDALYQLVYGHNLYNGGMFGTLPRYLDPTFCAAWPTFYYYTPTGSYRAQVFSVHHAVDDDALYTVNRIVGADYDAFLAALKAASECELDYTPPAGSRVLTLSTCTSSYAANRERVVLHAVLEPMADA